MSLNIKKGDLVKILSGKNKGQQGKVTRVVGLSQVVVEGWNKVKKHQKPTQKNQAGGIQDKEMPIAVSNVMLMNPKTGKPTRVKRTRITGKPSVRVSVKDGNEI